jgi:hypothetical protein
MGVKEMIESRIVFGVACACALGSLANADLTVDVGRFNNVHPAPNYGYVGDWSGFISSTLDQGYTVIDIDVAGIMALSGDRYLRSVSIRDFGFNSYGASSPGADIDFVDFVGLDPTIDVEAAYTGPTGEHLGESSDELMNRLSGLDAFTGADHEDDDVYVSLGRQGRLELLFSQQGGGGNGGGGSGGDGGGGTGIDPFGADGVAGQGLMLRIAEAGSMERFTVHFETTNVPAPAVAPFLGALLFGRRRRRS